jgi:hypothetical protein
MAVIKIVPMPGAKGDQGDDGATGAQGLQGPIGETGPAGADALWNYNGEWSPSATYAEGDVVTYNGQTYYATGITTLATTPDIDLNFDLIAAKGADGLNGVDGAQGEQGIQGIQGEQGIQGIQGIQGETGPAGADALWNYTGAYSGGSAYGVGDLATYDGQLWYRKHANGGNVGDTPSEGSFWDLLAAKGADGAQGPQGEPGQDGSIANLKFGSFFDTTIQPGGAISPISLNSTDFSNGVTIVDGSRITMDTLGIYNIAFSLQLEKTGGSSADIYIWMRHNDVDVPDTATIIHMANNNNYNVAAWNFFVNCDVLPQDFQLMWYTASTSVSISAINDAGTPVGVPSIPSVIVTVNKVGDL